MLETKNNSLDLINLLKSLFKIDRYILGEGYNKSLKKISEIIPIDLMKYPSGTSVESWKILDEWKVRHAYIEDLSGKKVVDFKDNPLHLWQYSKSFKKKISKTELENHLESKPGSPEAIPFIVAFYSNSWGFSISENQKNNLKDDYYKVDIDVEFSPKDLSIGHLFIPGTSKKEILIDAVLSCPSLANNLSGSVISTFLAKYLLNRKDNYFSYRFVFTPETIGPLTLGIKEKKLIKNIEGGVSFINLGDKSNIFNYKKSRIGNSVFDQAADHLSRISKEKIIIEKFDIKTGTCGNEKAYNSLGLEIPIGRFCKNIPGSYHEYDTSSDNMFYISEKKLIKSLNVCIELIEILERNKIYKNIFKGEPFLTSFGLLPKIKKENDRLLYDYLMAFCDGKNSILDIANKSGLSIFNFDNALKDLIQAKLIKLVD